MNKKLIKRFAKIAISVALLYLVYTKIDFASLVDLYKTLDLLYLSIAIVLFVLSQGVSSLRLSYIFHKNSLPISQMSNLKLYFVGMFYNFFIPGGIGGDAYKIIILKNKFNWSGKLITKIILLDRLLGLLAISCLAAIIASYLFFEELYFLILGFIIAIIFFLLAKVVFKIFDKEIQSYYSKGFWYSMVIQLLQVASVLFILRSIQTEALNLLGYALVFLVSSVASVVSFSGFGAREYIFLKASEFLGTEAVVSTSIGLSFNLITAIISLVGVVFILTKLNLQVQPPTQD